jgi:hypothetical protein
MNSRNSWWRYKRQEIQEGIANSKHMMIRPSPISLVGDNLVSIDSSSASVTMSSQFGIDLRSAIEDTVIVRLRLLNPALHTRSPWAQDTKAI